MKKFILLSTLVLLAFSACGDRKTNNIEELPASAQEFIFQYYPTKTVERIVIKNHRKDYQHHAGVVLFSDKSKIVFDSNGQWQEIEDHKNYVLAQAILPAINEFIREFYPGFYVVSIKRDHELFEIRLNNDKYLTFDLTGNSR